MNYKTFYQDARERVLSTAVVVAGAVGTVQLAVAQTGLFQEQWEQLTAIGAVAVALNIVKVLAAKKIGNTETAAIDRAPAVEGDGASFRCGAECNSTADDDGNH